MFFGAWPRACAPWQRARGQLVASSAGGRGGSDLVPVLQAGGLGAGAPGGRGCADQGGRGCAPVPVRGRACRWMVEGGREGRGARAWAWARVVLGRGCAVCGILWAWACGRVVFLGAVDGAWCFLRGDGVASVVVVVWCRVVYPPNKTCNAKTSYKYAILVLACKSLCGA